MEYETIDDIVNDKNSHVEYEALRLLLNQRLKELYEKEKETPLFDYADIRYSAMIDLIYDIMPSLRDEIDIEKSNKEFKEPIVLKN